MNIEEIWKPIIGYNKIYEISNIGRVKSFYKNSKEGNILNPNTYLGYYSQMLYLNKIGKRLFIHKLVAIHFIDNPNEYCTVDHIDKNPINNVYTNLRWVSRTQNNYNRSLQINNTSGQTGVSFNTFLNKWNAYIYKNDQRIQQLFEHKEDAINWRIQMVKQFYDSDYNSSLNPLQNEYTNFKENYYTLNKTDELWKDIIIQKRVYQISNYGRFRNKNTLKLLSPNIRIYVSIKMNNKKQSLSLSRLTAFHFVDNPHNYEIVDHIDNNKFNNHFLNLRWVNKHLNSLNAKIQSNNTSGFKGVTFDTGRKKWIGFIKSNDKTIFKRFDTKEEAKLYRESLIQEYFSEKHYRKE